MELPNSEFRVLPYLQLYGRGQFQITWFSRTKINSSFQLLNAQGTIVWNSEIIAEEVPEIFYTQIELNESIEEIPQGSWLYESATYKHQAILPVLEPGKTYTYRVKLGSTDYSSSFKTAPDAESWEHIRFVALADSETEPIGRIIRRAWYPADLSFRPSASSGLWKDKFGITTEQGINILNYIFTEKEGYQENLKIINERDPDFMVMPGDLVQGSAYQPGWDEFFRQNAGDFGAGLSRYPILPALGNWENSGAKNGGYGFNANGDYLPKLGRERFHAYFETPSLDPLQKHRQSYYRVDYGPITLLTIDSSNGAPDQSRSDYEEGEKLINQEFSVPGTDTQENYTEAEYKSNGGTDLSGFGPGTDQFRWLESNLKSAKEAGQLIFAQFHHMPFSSGERGVPINHELATGQEGVPMQVLHPLFEEYGVVAVFAGHDELFERSFVDKNNDGEGVLYYDVGVAGDGMRGEKRNWLRNPLQLLNYNPYKKWTADQNEKEQWDTSGINPILKDGGKHYGHLEVNLQKIVEGDQEYALINFTPVYIFPVLNQDYSINRIERRIYNDEIQVKIPLRVVAEEPEFKNDIRISLSENGMATTKASDYFISGYSDSYTYDFSRELNFTCADLGLNEVLVKVKSEGIVKWEGKVKVTVLDELRPELHLKEYQGTIDVTFWNTFEINQEHIIAGISDNCGENLEVTYSPKTIGCEDFNTPVKVEVTVKDQSGNTTSRSTFVTIEKTESRKVSLSGPATATIGSEVLLELGTEFEYQVMGWYKGDELFSSSTSKVITIRESGVYSALVLPLNGCGVFTQLKEVKFQESPDSGDKPYPPLKDLIEIPLNENGIGEISLTDPFTSSLPEGLNVSLNQQQFTCENLGEQQILVIIEGADGKVWEEQVNLKVLDLIPPVLETKNLELELDLSSGSLILEAEDFISKVSDNCSIQELSINKTELTCESVGKEIQVEIRAVDASGNVTENTAEVFVKAKNSKPVMISGPESICVGDRKEISLNSEAGFEVVRWRRNGVEIQGEKGKSLEIGEGGVYHAIVRYEGACLFETEKIEVQTIEKPSGEILEDGNLLKAPEGDFEYQWFRNGEVLDGETDAVLELMQMGLYSVEMTNSSGCTSTLGPVEITISGLIPGEVVSQDLKIYPNPVSIEVVLEPIGEVEFIPDTWMVLDTNGKVVASAIHLVSQGATRIVLDISGLASGTYLVSIEGVNNQVFLGRIIKVK